MLPLPALTFSVHIYTRFLKVLVQLNMKNEVFNDKIRIWKKNNKFTQA
jgi:hypothetical protein